MYVPSMKELHYGIFLTFLVGVVSNGVFDFGNLKNKILQWKNQKISSLCPSNGPQLQNLLNLVCSTAQPTNVTARDACITCFTQVTTMPEGPQELSALSVCALQYFANTTYAECAMAVMITQCTREARTGVNITLDADNVSFYTNVTSCILAKLRCSNYNPITGELQTPGYTSTGVRVSNALQFTESGDLRIIAFPANTPVSISFCSQSSGNLTQTNWLTNVC